MPRRLACSAALPPPDVRRECEARGYGSARQQLRRRPMCGPDMRRLCEALGYASPPCLVSGFAAPM